MNMLLFREEVSEPMLTLWFGPVSLPTWAPTPRGLLARISVGHESEAKHSEPLRDAAQAGAFDHLKNGVGLRIIT
jgi:hypothetical protein